MKPEQEEEFKKIAKPLIKWLCENCNPHTSVIIDCTSAEVVEGVCGIVTDEYVRD